MEQINPRGRKSLQKVLPYGQVRSGHREPLHFETDFLSRGTVLGKMAKIHKTDLIHSDPPPEFVPGFKIVAALLDAAPNLVPAELLAMQGLAIPDASPDVTGELAGAEKFVVSSQYNIFFEPLFGGEDPARG